MEKFKILKNGLVQGGNAEYEFDGNNKITYSASIKVGLGFLAKTHSRNGEILLDDPSIMLSENLKVEVEKQFGPLKIKAVQKEGKIVTCALEADGLSGHALVGTAQKFVLALGGKINFSVAGMNLAIELEKL
jgi:hypothetical protein